MNNSASLRSQRIISSTAGGLVQWRPVHLAIVRKASEWRLVHLASVGKASEWRLVHLASVRKV